MVCREKVKREDIVKSTSSIFRFCHVMDCEEDINKILILSNMEIESILIEKGEHLSKSLGGDSSDTVNLLLSKMRLA